MLIYFQASTAELEDTSLDELEELFAELARASMRGHHMILIDRQCCDWIVENSGLGRREKAHIVSLKQAYSQQGSMRQAAPHQLVIGLGSSGLERVGAQYQVGHKPLLLSNYLDKTVLLVENADNDGDFVWHVFNGLKKNHFVKNISFTPRHGGGSTIVERFDAELQDKNIVVCLVDSDKKSPNSRTSSTVRALKRTAQLQTFVGGLFVTKCREIENYIPLQVILTHNLCPTYPDRAKVEEVVERHAKATLDPDEHVWMFFDVKKGFNGATALGANYDKAVVDWLSSAYALGEAHLGDIKISGFGDALLRQFLNSNRAIADFVTCMSEEPWKTTFASFFHEMIWFLAADRKKAAR